MANVGRAGIAALTLLFLLPFLASAEPRAFGDIVFGVEVKQLLSKRPDARCAERWGGMLPYTRCIVDLTWAEVPVQVEYRFLEAGGPARILTTVILRFSEADAPRIREALRAEYEGEGRPIVACCAARPTFDTWWSGPATEAYMSSTTANVTSREHGELAQRRHFEECEKRRAICEP
jgi:hypothetical protein